MVACFFAAWSRAERVLGVHRRRPSLALVAVLCPILHPGIHCRLRGRCTCSLHLYRGSVSIFVLVPCTVLSASLLGVCPPSLVPSSREHMRSCSSSFRLRTYNLRRDGQRVPSFLARVLSTAISCSRSLAAGAPITNCASRVRSRSSLFPN